VPYAQAVPASATLPQLAEQQSVTLGQLINLQMHNEMMHQGIIIIERLLGGSTHPTAAHGRYGEQPLQ
jgi:hypothetical protein